MKISINMAPPKWGKTQKVISSYIKSYNKKEKCLIVVSNYDSKISVRNAIRKSDVFLIQIIHQNAIDFLHGLNYSKIIVDDFTDFTQRYKDTLFNYLQNRSIKKVEIWSNFECQHKKDRLLNYYKSGSCGSEYNDYCKNIFFKNTPNFLNKELFII